jgi:hypothetical protein
MSLAEEIAAAAARLVVEEGLDYDGAKRKAARDFGPRPQLPDNEAVEDAVREHIALFCADTQPAELRALRELAQRWMQRLQEFRPHLAGAVWRGTATRWSPVQLDLYCDDPKAAEIALINAGIDYDVAQRDPGLHGGRGGRPGREPVPVLIVGERCAALGEVVTLHLVLQPLDDLRGALKPDARGRSWRGDGAALGRLLEAAA